MRTAFQHPLNIFTTLLKNYDMVTERSSDSNSRTNYDCKLGIRTGLKLSLKPMDRDSVKKLMLKQEEIFRQQVRELHRLYQAQRQLMSAIRSDEGTSSSLCHHNRHQSTSQLSSEDSRLNQYESWENIRLEGPFRKPKGFDLEQPAVETTIENTAHDQASSLWRHLRQRTTMVGPEIDTGVEIGCSVSDPSVAKKLSGQDTSERGGDFPVISREESLQGPRRNFQGLSLDIEEEMNPSTWMRR